nr:monalysin family beta-barrel pore-forming toxin [uncultured Pseudomonas sp.]
MSIINTKMIEQISYEMPEKQGSYDIDNYLLGGAEQAPNPGCWVRGRTIFGDMWIGNQNWATFSVPVFAYLEHIQTVRLPSDSTYNRAVEIVQGFSSSVTHTTEIEVSLGTGFIKAGAGGMKLSSSYTDGIHGSTKRTESFKLQGPGQYNFYQVNVVYAHLAESAGGLSPLFEYSQVKQHDEAREDLCFLTSIATDTIVPVLSSDSIEPLGWHEIQRAVLMKSYDASDNSGHFVFHLSARYKPGRSY